MAEESRIEQLSAAIRHHRELYYNHSAPEISDADFDKLWDELKSLDPGNSVLHEVGPEPLPGTVKVEHIFPMRSWNMLPAICIEQQLEVAEKEVKM